MKVDYLNACFAACVGALVTLRKAEPSHHTRKAIKLNDLVASMDSVVDRLPVIPEGNISNYLAVFSGLEGVLPELLEGDDGKYSDLLINIATFCLDELPTTENIKYRLKNLISCYPDTDEYDAIRKGHRAFNRLCTEIDIANSELGDVANG